MASKFWVVVREEANDVNVIRIGPYSRKVADRIMSAVHESRQCCLLEESASLTKALAERIAQPLVKVETPEWQQLAYRLVLATHGEKPSLFRRLLVKLHGRKTDTWSVIDDARAEVAKASN